MKTRSIFIIPVVSVICLLMMYCTDNKKEILIGSSRLGIEAGKEAGLDGVEICVHDTTDILAISDLSVRLKYKEDMAKTGLAVPSLSMLMLNYCALATDERAPGWLEQCIDASADLGATRILMPFFMKGNLLTKERQLKTAEIDALVERLKAVAPRAEKAGVVLCIENTLSAEQNLEILKRIGSKSVALYYDVKNTAGMGYDVPAEIRLLRDNIAQIHFKNGASYMGDGGLDFPSFAKAIKDIDYKGWIVLETSKISGDDVADAKREAIYTRELFME